MQGFHPGTLGGWQCFVRDRAARSRSLWRTRENRAFAGVNGLPVVPEYAARIPGVGRPRPAGIVDVVALDVPHQVALPMPGDIRCHGAAPKLAQEHRRRPLLLQVRPMALPCLGQAALQMRAAKPALRVNLWPIVMHRVDEFGRLGQAHGELLRAYEIGAPPRPVTVVLFDTLHDDEPVWIGSQHHVPGALGRQTPVCAQIAVAPRGGAVRLVVQVCSYHGGIASIVAGGEPPPPPPTPPPRGGGGGRARAPALRWGGAGGEKYTSAR